MGRVEGPFATAWPANAVLFFASRTSACGPPYDLFTPLRGGSSGQASRNDRPRNRLSPRLDGHVLTVHGVGEWVRAWGSLLSQRERPHKRGDLCFFRCLAGPPV